MIRALRWVIGSWLLVAALYMFGRHAPRKVHLAFLELFNAINDREKHDRSF